MPDLAVTLYKEVRGRLKIMAKLYHYNILGDASATAVLYKNGNVFIHQEKESLNDVYTINYRRKDKVARRSSRLPKWVVAAIERGKYVQVESMEAVEGDRGFYLVVRGKEVSPREEKRTFTREAFDLEEIQGRLRTVKFLETREITQEIAGETYGQAVLSQKEVTLHREQLAVLPWNQEEHRLKNIAEFLNLRNPKLWEVWRGHFAVKYDNDDFVLEEGKEKHTIDQVDLDSMTVKTIKSISYTKVWSTIEYKVESLDESTSPLFKYKAKKIVPEKQEERRFSHSVKDEKTRRIISKRLKRRYTKSSSGKTGDTRPFGLSSEWWFEDRTYEEWEIEVEDFGTWIHTKCVDSKSTIV